MVYLFQQIFYRPTLNLLIYLYEATPMRDFGIAIILVAIIIRLILFPFFHRGTKQQMMMQRIQPKIKKIQEQHKDDRQKQTEALLALYKEHGVNPLSSMFLLFLQLPIMAGLYWVVHAALIPGELAGLYSFIPQPGTINHIFLGIMDLTKSNWLLTFLAAFAQYIQARIAIYRNPSQTGEPSQAEKMARQMSVIGPLITVFIFYRLPSAVGLYWLVTSLFSIFQQILINRHFRKGETAAI